jgi:hypothetical protein
MTLRGKNMAVRKEVKVSISRDFFLCPSKVKESYVRKIFVVN